MAANAAVFSPALAPTAASNMYFAAKSVQMRFRILSDVSAVRESSYHLRMWESLHTQYDLERQ